MREGRTLHHDAKGRFGAGRVILRPAPPEFLATWITPYVKGQRFALFLGKSEETAGDQLWSIVGSPFAGNLPVDDEHVYFDSYDLEGFGYSEREVHGVRRSVQRFDLDAFKDAVTAYRICFSWRLEERIKNNKVRTRWVPSRACDEAAVQDYRGKSRIHEYLAQTTLQQIPAGSDQQQ